MIKKDIRKRVKKLSLRKEETKNNELYSFIHDHLVEEMSELIQAISKCKRTRFLDSSRLDNLHEEIADVYIGISDLIAISDIKAIETWMEKKMDKKEKYFENNYKGKPYKPNRGQMIAEGMML